MWMLDPDTALTVGSDVDMVDLATEEEGVVSNIPVSGTDVDGVYALMLETSTTAVTIYHLGFNEVVTIHEEMAGESFQGKVDLLCTDTPYNVRSRQHRPTF